LMIHAVTVLQIQNWFLFSEFVLCSWLSLFSGRVRLTTNLEFIFNGCSALGWRDHIEEFPALK
jgi:hypothetical protein